MSNIRPIYFIVVVWGERFRSYLTDYCIPSFLSPNNIPKLINNRNNKFLICTTIEDWNIMQHQPSFIKLKQFMEPVLIEIQLPPDGVSSCQHMGVGHKLAVDICFKEKVYGIAITPDLLIADGTLNNIQKLALTGKQLVLCAAVRFAEEPFFNALEREGFKSKNSMQTELSINSRELVKLCLQSFHSETETYDFNSSNYGKLKAIALWRLPNNQGLLLHSLSWCPMLIDYGAIHEHDTTALEKWTMDGDYLCSNFKDYSKIHISQDSDEIMLVSWAPLEYQQYKLKKQNNFLLYKKYLQYKNRLLLEETLRHPIMDQLKIKFFPKSIYWHTNDIDKMWKKYDETIMKFLQKTPSFIWLNIYLTVSSISRYSIKTVQYSIIAIFAICGVKKAKQRLSFRLNLLKQNYFKN